MKTSISALIFALILPVLVYQAETCAQSCYNPLVDSVISQVSLSSLSILSRELSGDTMALIGGVPQLIYSRYWQSPSNQKAAQYIFEKFQSFGYVPYYQTYSTTGVNIIAKKMGLTYPNKQYIICGHYDNITTPIVFDTIHGADDNGTGTVAVLEAARILKNYAFDYTIVFAAWDEEEKNHDGSKYYANLAYENGDSILAVINLDMLGWDGNGDNRFLINTNLNSLFYANVLGSSSSVYQPLLSYTIDTSGFAGSDHHSFWLKGYKAIHGIEDEAHDFNIYFHQVGDNFLHLNKPYFMKLTKSAIAALVVLQRDYIINFEHEPFQSGSDTSSRIAKVIINSNRRIPRGSNSPNIPRLYYKVGDGQYNWCNAIYTNLDTFKFLIPGQPLGSTVFYYFAAQDSLGAMVGSLPAGARGFSPPGTIPPPYPFSYRILKQLNICSNTLPKGLLPKSIVFDTIKIQQQGSIHDYNLNLTIYHTNDSDLYIWVMRPDVPMLQLSTANGGDGDNYFNTTFDDEATIPITQGTPPFIGSFKPEQNLSALDKYSMQGTWLLRIYNNSPSVSGQLVNWCMSFIYYDPIGITNNQVPVRSSLTQNYPNPFNSSTKISFTLGKKAHVKMIVYDVLGREVAVVTEGYYGPGSYNADFNGTNLASGLYFYTMYIDGKSFETRKMALIK